MRLTIDPEGSPQRHLDILNAICAPKGLGRALDVMCCEGNSTKHLNYARKVFVDIQYRDIEMNPKDLFVVTDVFNFLSHDDCIYDVALCMDGIEHLEKGEGHMLIKGLEKTSDKVVFFTPLGNYVITDDNDPDHHHSGWLPEEFEALGYHTIVMPNFHRQLNVGAFFAFKYTMYFSLEETARLKESIKAIESIKTLPWIKN